MVVVTGVLYGTTRRSSHPVEEILSCFLFSSALFAFAAASFFSRALSPRRSRAADTVHNLYYRHRCPVHGTAYASLFLHPSASVITQLGQSCSAATRLSLQYTAFLVFIIVVGPPRAAYDGKGCHAERARAPLTLNR